MMHSCTELGFENDVKMYGTQTTFCSRRTYNQFENDVKMYGTQTVGAFEQPKWLFENDVKMYGTQTATIRSHHKVRLRMM